MYNETCWNLYLDESDIHFKQILCADAKLQNAN
jgi:hypothetical protein